MTISRLTAIGSAAMIFAAGAGAAYVVSARARAPLSEPASPARAADNAAAQPDVIAIDRELAQRAGITVAPVQTSTIAGSVRVPGTVQPNAYRQVSVTPLVGGRVTRVFVELGQSVTRGAPIAEVYSPDVAAARAQYLSLQADTDAGEAKLRRTERLADLGSASQQELEQVRAEHVRHETEVRQAAARLRLLGLDPSTIGDAHSDDAPSTVTVAAPQAGVIVQRAATAGTTAEPSTVLATIAELSPVWIIADVYERDLGRIVNGAPATITAPAYPDVEFRGHVSYVSPDVRPETRTAQVRIELANPQNALRFGMFVTAAIGERSGPSVVVPRTAVQMIGADSVVFVPDDANATSFRERLVRVGAADGERLAIVEGLSPGERIVMNGSFVLRAEAERLAIRPDSSGSRERASPQAVTVRITAKGFEPDSISLQPGTPARVTFVRTTDETCATSLTLPDYGITRTLPLNEPVVVEFTPTKSAAFQCGMGMLAGKLVVR